MKFIFSGFIFILFLGVSALEVNADEGVETRMSQPIPCSKLKNGLKGKPAVFQPANLEELDADERFLGMSKNGKYTASIEGRNAGDCMDGYHSLLIRRADTVTAEVFFDDGRDGCENKRGQFGSDAQWTQSKVVEANQTLQKFGIFNCTLDGGLDKK